ncbi:hypothetical protein SLG_13240 [Sphingobium sp. SYK-6]|uniref:EF-hand domain-containing protein n=1 Tax=Sphingobium sp. (strain NBRC 103272 / SYK-6) TaxID=627192 RepID=UPI00022773AC|nr:EF-hand domain-containing protein [Sphingobium sp. SYK-6]BAK65999.1 hypothetical protein SLG_13240 [Sphingobium sp. SYK-6]
MSLRPTLLLIGAGLLSLGAAANAQPPGDRAGARPAPMDRSQVQARLEKHFDALDLNKDGTVTPEERKAGRTQMRETMRAHMFARLDADKNGSISKDEFAAAKGQHRKGPGEAGKMRRHPGAMSGMPMHHQLAAYKDKPLTRSQFVELGLGMFDRVDTDRDGKISPAEHKAAREAMRDRPAAARKPMSPPPGQ